MVNEEKEMKWVRENIDINHDDVIFADAERWFELMETDFMTFCRLAIYGFTVKLGGKGRTEIPGEVISMFLKEFRYKICLAVAGDVRIKGLPLFSIVGVEVIGEEMLKSDESFRIHPGAQA